MIYLEIRKWITLSYYARIGMASHLLARPIWRRFAPENRKFPANFKLDQVPQTRLLFLKSKLICCRIPGSVLVLPDQTDVFVVADDERTVTNLAGERSAIVERGGTASQGSGTFGRSAAKSTARRQFSAGRQFGGGIELPTFAAADSSGVAEEARDAGRRDQGVFYVGLA